MKKLFCLFMVCSLLLLMLVGCDIFDSSENGNYIAIYNNEIYDRVWDWYPITEEWQEVSVWTGYEEDVVEPIKYSETGMFLKTDTKRLFLANDNKISDWGYFLKRGQIIPEVYSNSVEKVVLSNDDVSSVTLEKEDLSLWLDFLKQCYSDKESYKLEEWNQRTMGSIDVYFIDFPIYYRYGHIGLSKSGKLAFSSGDFEEYNTYGIILPDDLSNCILSLGYKK